MDTTQHNAEGKILKPTQEMQASCPTYADNTDVQDCSNEHDCSSRTLQCQRAEGLVETGKFHLTLDEVEQAKFQISKSCKQFLSINLIRHI